MKKIFLIIFLLLGISSFGQEEYSKGKIIKEFEKTSAEDFEEEITYYRNFLVETEGKYKNIKVAFPVYKEKNYNFDLKKGDRVVLFKDAENNTYYIMDKVKTTQILVLLVIFVVLFLILAKFKGVKALLSLVAIISFFIFIIIPLIISGFSPILSAVILGVFSSLLTLYSLEKFSKKILAALVGTLGGILAAAILSAIFVKYTGITGYVDSETLSYSSLFENINLKALISAGIIIGSLGAIMDNSVSISSALFEVVAHSKDISRKKVFVSGINIGKDVMGTMVNTLILAYLGSSLFTLILLYKQQIDFPLVRILNSEFLIVEMLRALCGSIGIVLTVPITSYVSAILLVKKDEVIVEDIEKI